MHWESEYACCSRIDSVEQSPIETFDGPFQFWPHFVRRCVGCKYITIRIQMNAATE